MSEITTGVRAAGTFAPSFDYDVEMHKQSGSLRPKSIDAWAGHWNVGYTFKDARSKPRAFGEYNMRRATRTQTATSGGRTTKFTLRSQQDGLADQFGWKNIEDIRAGVTAKTWEKVDVDPNI
jgi:Alginate export